MMSEDQMSALTVRREMGLEPAPKKREKLKLQVVTHSERQTFRDCALRWSYAYLELLRPERVHEALRWGSLLHLVVARSTLVAMEFYAKRPHLGPRQVAEYAAVQAVCMMDEELGRMMKAANDLPDGASESMHEEIDEARPWLMFQAAHYHEVTWRDWMDHRVIGVELPFEVPLRDVRGRVIPHVTYAGMIDLLVLHEPTGRVLVQDLKGMQTFSGMERKLQLDEQTTGYLWAARELHRAGKLVTLVPPGLTDASFCGVAFNMVRKAAPAEPKINRVKKADCAYALEPDVEYKRIKALEDLDGVPRGRVSVAACDTLPGVYERALSSQMEDRQMSVESDQTAMLERLRGKGDTFFMRVESVRTDRDLARWCAEFLQDQVRMRACARNHSLITRNPGSCTRPGSAGCSYQPLCEAGEPASTRVGKTVYGFVRLADPHEEIARGKQEKADWEQRQRERQAREEAYDASSSGPGDGEPGEDEAGSGHGQDAAREGEQRGQGSGGGVAPHHGFF